MLRTGLAREPLTAARDSRLDPEHRELVRGLLLLAAGEVREARRALAEASQVEELDPSLGAAAAVGAAVAALLGAEAGADRQLADAIDVAERSGLPWLARMGRLAAAIGGAEIERSISPDAAGSDAISAETDPWGALLAALVEAWVAEPAGGEVGGEIRIVAAERAASLARRLGAGVLEALARGLTAFGMARDRCARGARRRARGREPRAHDRHVRPAPPRLRGPRRQRIRTVAPSTSSSPTTSPARPASACRRATHAPSGTAARRDSVAPPMRARARCAAGVGWTRHAAAARPAAGPRDPRVRSVRGRGRRSRHRARSGQAARPCGPAIPRRAAGRRDPSRGDPGGALAGRRLADGRAGASTSRYRRCAACSRMRCPSTRPGSSPGRATPTGSRSIPARSTSGSSSARMSKAREPANGSGQAGAGVADFAAALDAVSRRSPAAGRAGRVGGRAARALPARGRRGCDARRRGRARIERSRGGDPRLPARPRARSLPRPAVAGAHRGPGPGRRRGCGESRSTRVRLDPRGPRPQPGGGGELRLIAAASRLRARRHHGFLVSGSAAASRPADVPHFMQNRRAGLLGVEQFGQIRGGTTSPSGICCPHFMQNRRAALFGVPQFGADPHLLGRRCRRGSGGVGPGGAARPRPTPPPR